MVAIQTAVQFREAVLVVSAEMDVETFTNRCVSALTHIPYDNIHNAELYDGMLGQFAEAQSRFNKLPIHIEDKQKPTIAEIHSYARKAKSKYKQLGCIIIDYLQLSQMKHEKNRNREQEVAQAAHKAKMLARELNIPVILLSQLNRESENRPGRKPMLSDLRESGSIEQDADLVILLYRPAMAQLPTDKESGYPTDGLGIAIIAKHRNGQTGNVYFGHNSSMTCIGDYVPPIEWMQRNSKQIAKKE